MTRVTSLTPPLMLATLLIGCAFPNQFRDVDAHSANAVLIEGGYVRVTRINDQPINVFLHMSQTFRIPTGHTSVETVAGVHDFHKYETIQFRAEAGQRYTIRGELIDGSNLVVLRDSGEQIVAEAGRWQRK